MGATFLNHLISFMSSESTPARDEPPLASSNDVAPQTEDGLDQGSYTAHRLVCSVKSSNVPFIDLVL